MVLCVLIMFAVWLQGYPDATLQASSNIPRIAADPRNADAIVPKRLRHRLTLPQPDWFTRRAASSNAIAAQVSNADSDESSGCVVQALATVEAASVWQNDLTYLNEEEFLGFEYFLNPTDFFSLCIDSVFPVQQTFRVASSKMFSLQRQADGVVQHRDPESFVVQLASKTVPFSPYVPGVDFARIPLVSGQQALPAQQVLNMWGLREEVDSCVVVPLPHDFVMDVQGPDQELPQRADAVAFLHEEPQQAEIHDNAAWPPPASATDVLFLRYAIAVPGLLHIVNNALCEVSGKLSYFVFFEQLGEFEGLVTCGRLLRFVNYCVKPSLLASQADELLQRKFGRLYLKRWGEVVCFCRRLAVFLPLIRCVWNEQAYAHGGAGAENDADDEGGGQRAATRFSPERFTSILKDPMFFAYFDTVLKLSNAIEQLSHWAESCPCHEDLQLPNGLQRFDRRGRNESQTHFRRARERLRSMFQGDAETCVMQGRRLPELVAGGLDAVLSNFSNLVMTELMQNHRPFLSDAQWSSLIADFESGKSHAQLEFSVKLDWVQRLPWKLALLAHRDQAKSRRELLLIIQDFDSQSPELQQHHHSLTRHLLLKSGDLRRDLDRFVAGCSLQELPRLEFMASCFRLVQITERSYEAAHSIVKRKVPPNAAGPVVSLSLRLHDLARAVKLEPNTLMEVAAEFSEARQVRRIPGLLGLAAHPDIVQCVNKKWHLVKRLNKVLYRSDVSGQFPELSHVEAGIRRTKTSKKEWRKNSCLKKI